MGLLAWLRDEVAAAEDGITLALAEINKNRQNMMSAQYLNNKLNPNYKADQPNVEQFEAILRRLDLYLPLAEYCVEHANAVVVVLPEVPESDIELLEAYMTMPKELADIGTKFTEAYADGDISGADYKTIEREIDQLVTAALTYKKVVKLKAGVK